MHYPKRGRSLLAFSAAISMLKLGALNIVTFSQKSKGVEGQKVCIILLMPKRKRLIKNSARSQNLLEPYRYTRKALRELTAFTDEYLTLLDFSSLPSYADLEQKIKGKKIKDPDTCFISKVYWKRNTNLPLLFPSR